jgi:hypothetical protein
MFLSRRELLKRGLAVGLGGGIVSLAASEARASGSWAATQRSNYHVRPSQYHGGSRSAAEGSQTSGWSIPGSYEWRRQRDASREEKDLIRGEWRRFSHDDE